MEFNRPLGVDGGYNVWTHLRRTMKLSKQIKNSLLSIETILDNALRIAQNQNVAQVTISRNDASRMLESIDEHIDNLRDIENLTK